MGKQSKLCGPGHYHQLQGGYDALRTHSEENSRAGELLLCQLKHPGMHWRTTRYLLESWWASWHAKHRCSITPQPPQSAVLVHFICSVLNYTTPNLTAEV